MINVTRVRRMMRRRHRVDRHAAYRIFHKDLCDGLMPMQVSVRFVFIMLHGSVPASLHHVGLDTMLRSRGEVFAGLGARPARLARHAAPCPRSEEHTSELQSLMRISYAVFCLKK